MNMDRRSFLAGLFGTAAVVAAGTMPKALEALNDTDFRKVILDAMPDASEVYMNEAGLYGFPTLRFLDTAPWVEVSVPEGFRPMREESNRISAEAIARIKAGA